MGAPLVEASAGSGGSGGTLMPVLLPAGEGVDGEDLWVVAICTGDTAVTAPSGFTRRKEHIDGGLSRLGVYTKTYETGDEGSAATFTVGAPSKFAAVAVRVSGSQPGTLAFSVSQDGAGDTVSFLESAPTWEERETLWLAVAGWVDDDETVVSWPDTFVHSRDSFVSGGGVNAGAGVAVASRRFTASSMAPEDLGLSAAEAWSSFTMAIRQAQTGPAPAPSGKDRAGLEVSVKADADWVDVGEQSVYQRSPVQIRGGRSDWASGPEPSRMRVVLDNRQGQWSPDFPGSNYHRMFRRGAEIRGGAAQSDSYVEWCECLEESLSGVVEVDPDAQLDVTGSFDIRAEFEMTADLAVGDFVLVASKEAVWELYLGRNSAGLYVRLVWVDSLGTRSADSNAFGEYFPLDLMWRRRAIRVTVNASNGRVQFFYGMAADGSWTGVSNQNSGLPSTGLITAGSPLSILSFPVSPAGILRCRLYRLLYLDGISGTVAADADFRAVPPGTASPDTGDGLTWTVLGQGRVSATRWRHHGQIVSLPTPFAVKGDQWVDVESAGPLHKIRQGNPPAFSPIRRAYDREVVSGNVASYWPMEETGSEFLPSFSAAIGPYPLVRRAGTVSLAQSGVFASSDKLPRLKTSQYVGRVGPPPGGFDGRIMIRCLFFVEANPLADVNFMNVRMPGKIWKVIYTNSGSIRVDLWTEASAGGFVLDTSGSNWGFTIEDTPVQLQLSFFQNGADIEVTVTVAEIDSLATGGGTDTFTGETLSWPSFVITAPLGDAEDFVVGHLVVEDAIRSTSSMIDDLTAYNGETAADRIRRVLGEEGYESRIAGDPAESVRMGPQPIASGIEIVDEAAATDGGVLYDSPDRFAIGYRTANSMRNQEPVIEVDFDGGDAHGTVDLVRDYNKFANDVFVTNSNGSRARATLTEGPLSANKPPDGAGRIEQTYDVNCYNPFHFLQDLAGLRLLAATVDEPRMERIRFALHAASAAARQSVLEAGPGDLLSVTDLPATLYPYDLDQIFQGWTETIGGFEWLLDVNTGPASPWQLGTWDGPEARYDSAGSVLVSGVEAGATTLHVATTSGPRWTTDSGDVPFDVSVGGLVVTVAAIADAGAVQAFTVDPVARDLPGGADVRLARPSYWSN